MGRAAYRRGGGGARLAAAADIEALARLGSAENIVEGAVVGTVLGASLLAALRRMAHAEASRKRFDRT